MEKLRVGHDLGTEQRKLTSVGYPPHSRHCSRQSIQRTESPHNHPEKQILSSQSYRKGNWERSMTGRWPAVLKTVLKTHCIENFLFPKPMLPVAMLLVSQMRSQSQEEHGMPKYPNHLCNCNYWTNQVWKEAFHPKCLLLKQLH